MVLLKKVMPYGMILINERVSALDAKVTSGGLSCD